MKTNLFSDPTEFHTVENTTLRSYRTRERAEQHAMKWLTAYGDAAAHEDIRATVLVQTRADGRLVPIIVAQGRDATHFACATAQSGNGLMVFA